MEDISKYQTFNLYHGGISPIDNPDPYHTEGSADFGLGFYCTQNFNQAIEWGKHKLKTAKNLAREEYAVSEYKFHNKKNLTFKYYDSPSAEWMETVYKGRRGLNINADVVTGPVADAGIRDLIIQIEHELEEIYYPDDFKKYLKCRKEIFEKAAEKAIPYKYKNYDQEVFLSENAIGQLEFLGARIYDKNNTFCKYMDKEGLIHKVKTQKKDTILRR